MSRRVIIMVTKEQLEAIKGLAKELAVDQEETTRFLKAVDEIEAAGIEETDNALWIFRQALYPSAIFEFDWRGHPDQAEVLSRLCRRWGADIEANSLYGDDLPELLMDLSESAPNFELSLWVIDTGMDMYVGFIVPQAKDDSIKSLCTSAEIDILDVG